MRAAFLLLPSLLAAACSTPPPAAPRPAAPAAAAVPLEAIDDGSYIDRIDPLGGQWDVVRIGGEDFRRYEATINFQGGGFLNHGAGCRGGYPAFYRHEGQRLTISRREPVRTGKCEEAPTGPAAAAASEVRLGRFLDQVASWSRPDARTLLLKAADGTQALLTRPIEPHPDLAGRWLIETIGGNRFVTERRPPILSINRGGIGAVGDCNSPGTSFTVPAPGRLSISPQIISTQMGCPAEDMAEDSLMARAIAGATRYRIEGDRMIISGGPGMTLRRPPAPDRRLVGDYESCGNTLLGGYHEGPITLRFEAGSVTDNAGCRATYRTAGPGLAITLGGGPACTGKAVPYVPGEPIPVGGAISTLAVLRPDGFAFSDEGVLVLRTNRGHLTMCRKGQPKPFGSG